MDVHIDLYVFGILCFLVYTPLCWVRKIEKFNATHIFADALIVITAIIVIIYTIKYAVDQHGLGPGLEVLNKSTFLNIIGFSVYAYEGIGIILPCMDITEN